MFRIGAILILVIYSSKGLSQRTCIVNNLWQNGSFENANSNCIIFNPLNKYSNTNAPWYGFTCMRWQPKVKMQPTYLNEADFDHTVGNNNGHYLYLDPRNKSGWDYEFQQNIKVEKNTQYTFSMWYCSMNKPSNPGATIRLIVNGTDVSGQVTIPNVNNKWVKIGGNWNSGTSVLANASLQTYKATVGGHDFAIDDISFEKGKLIAFAGNDLIFCKNDTTSISLVATAQLGVGCGNSYSYIWEPSNYISGNNKVPNPILKKPYIPGKYYVVITDLDGNQCSDTVNVSISTNQLKAKNVFNDTSFCSLVNYTVKVPDNYSLISWDDNSKSYTRNITKAGTYFIKFSDSCFNYVDTFKVKLKNTIVPFDFTDTTVCPGESVIKDLSFVKGYNSILWDNGFTAITREISKSGDYWVTLYSDCGNYTDSFKVRILKEPIPNIPTEISLCQGEDTLVKIPYYFKNISWSDLDTSHLKRVSSKGVLSLNYQGICDVYNSTCEVKVNPMIASLYIPNAFTPDDNSINEYFPLKEISFNARLQIYSRWGNAVYDSNSKPVWDGKYMEKQLSDDVFVYILSYKNCNNELKIENGTFHLLK